MYLFYDRCNLSLCRHFVYLLVLASDIIGCCLLTACMAQYGTYGIPATDLSDFHVGMSRSEVEAMLGVPKEIHQTVLEDDVPYFCKAYYEYDRGYPIVA